MNLLEALEKKRALESILNDLIEDMDSKFCDLESLSATLSEIDNYVDDIFGMERNINFCYQNTKVSKTESISDAFSHIDGLTKKIEVLKYLLLRINKKEILTGTSVGLDQKSVLSSIRYYEDLKNKLVDRVKEVCENTPFIIEELED